MKLFAAASLAAFFVAASAAAQTLTPANTSTVFKDGASGDKIHIASGFVCPEKIGRYIRDAVGESDLETGSDFCSYYALDGVYGTVTLTPLSGSYSPVASLQPFFTEQEGIGGRMIGEKTVAFGPKASPLSIYTRTYETAKLETLHYRILFAGAAVKNWAVESTIEYAEPRDDEVERAFLDAVYLAALGRIGNPSQAAK